MWRLSALLLVLATAITPDGHSSPSAKSLAADSLTGRWDIVIRTARGSAPSWLELELSGRDALVGRFVGIVGSARPVSPSTTMTCVPRDTYTRPVALSAAR
jgi:hypothetical protein